MLDVVAALTTELGASNVYDHHYDPYGRKFQEHNSPPLVVWEPTSASYSVSRDNSGWDNPRKLWTRTAEVRVHIWAETEELALAAMKNELVGLSMVANTAIRPKRDVPGAANAAWLSKGFAIILTLEVDSPIEDKLVPTGRAKAIVYTSTSTPGDGWLESGET